MTAGEGSGPQSWATGLLVWKQHWQAGLGSVCYAEGHRFCSVGNEGSHFEHNMILCFSDLLHALLFKCEESMAVYTVKEDLLPR